MTLFPGRREKWHVQALANKLFMAVSGEYHFTFGRFIMHVDEAFEVISVAQVRLITISFNMTT